MSVNIKDNVMTPDLLRTYEISLWTLQDSFIAVLGDSSSQTRGYIENPVMQISNDGTQELNFSLPMYIDDGITRKKNGIWAQMTNAVTIAGMRKIKVIFNKGTDVEKVYEFIITTVTDTHESNRPMCEIHCEGLAFHELGKIGYKLNLSRDSYYADYEAEWDALATQLSSNNEYENIENLLDNTTKPTINYWCEKIGLVPYPGDAAPIQSSIWYYQVIMDWSSFSSGYARDKNKVYEEPYVASYNSELSPTDYIDYAEKLRYVEAGGSNIYNLTQEIAKIFGVYCRYDYKYDVNYHITARIVTFYNNYIDDKNRLEFTYPYTTKRITRENDCTDLVTKMYVNAVESDNSSTGVVTIMDNPVNPTGEDYLLNFDYLYAIGTITEELYKYITTFSKAVKALNKKIITALTNIIKRLTVLVTYEALLTTLSNLKDEDLALYNAYHAYEQNMTDDGVIHRTGDTGIELYVTGDTISFIDEGVLANTIKIFESNKTTSITKAKITLDTQSSSGYAIGASNLTGYSSVYVEYDYCPYLYYKEVANLYKLRTKIDKLLYDALDAEKKALETAINSELDTLDDLTIQKDALLKKFERTMGPALREGNWTPEDYTNVAHASYKFINTMKFQYTWSDDTIVSLIAKNSSGPKARLIWDADLNYNEFTNYELNMSGEKDYYYVLELTSARLKEIKAFYANSSNDGIPFGLVWWHNNWDTTTNMYPSPVVKMLTIGSDCECIFLSKKVQLTDGTYRRRYVPALVLPTLTANERTTFKNDNNICLCLCGIKSEYNEKKKQFIIERTQRLTEDENNPDYYIIDKTAVYKSENRTAHCLRFRINDYTLLTDEVNLKVFYGNSLLKEFDDYSIAQIVHTTNSEQEDNGYDITFKPLSLIKLWNADNKIQVNYSCSLLGTAIYLDALQIAKENAYPKVTYSIEPNILYKDFFYTDYMSLNKIAFINDNELEFNLVQGYISSIELILDKPWEDSIEVKNYKNKFEDIFSTIVAQTETMEKNEAMMTSVGNAVNIDGSLSADSIESTISKITIKYSFSSGSIILNKLNGILASNSNGLVMLRPDGLSYFPSDGSNVTNAVSAKGINASAITYGLLSLDSFSLRGAGIEFNSSNGIYSYNNQAAQTLSIVNGVLSTNENGIQINNTDLKTYIENTVTSENLWSSISRRIPIFAVSIGNSNGNNTVYVTNDSIRLGASSAPCLLYDTNLTTSIKTLILGTAFDYSNSLINTFNLVDALSSSIFTYSNNVISVFKLGTDFIYDSGITNLTLGNAFTYDSTNGITNFLLGNILNYSSLLQTISGWGASSSGFVALDENDDVISLVSPTALKIDSYLTTFEDAEENKKIKLTELYLTRTDAENPHTITFCNDDLEETPDYKLKITDLGLFFSLDGGITYNLVAIVT